MRSGARTTVALLVAAVLLFPLTPTDGAHANSFEPEGVGVVDPATGEWHLRGPDGFTTSFFYGNPGDYPIMGDWNCDTIDTPGLYRQSDGYVYLRNSNTQGNADIRFYFGNPGDIPLAGDFNGDGCDTVSIYRQSEGRVYIINELGENDGGLGAADYDYYFGNPGDKPFTGDFNGNGTDTVGLHRESTGLVYFRYTNTQGVADQSFIFGDPGDRLIAGDWTDDGIDTVGLFRPSNFTIYLRHTNTQGNANEQFDYGIPRMLPVAGNFDISATKVADRSWTVGTADAPVAWGRFASLGFGADGRAVVSHGSKTQWATYELALTQCTNQTCAASTTRIEPWRVSDQTSMATGSDWLPVWSFHDDAGGQMVVGRCSDAACSTISYSVVDPAEPPATGQRSNSGVLSSMAIGADGLPIVLYMNDSYFTGLWLAHCDDVACTTATRSPLSGSLSDFHRFEVAVGIDGRPISAVFTSELGPFALAAMSCADALCSTGNATAIQTWMGEYFGWGFPSIVIGTDGLPIIAYNDLTVTYDGTPSPIHEESLKVAHCNNLTCTSSQVTKIVEGATDFISMDVGGDGLPFIAYRSGGALKVAHCKDVACLSSEIITVDAGPNVGLFTSLATDPLGMPMIAYMDEANHDLKIARLGS